mgnify:FL=1
MQKINNIHDKNFYQLVDSISSLSEEDLLFKIKFNYSFLPKNIKTSLENYFDKYKFWGSLHEDNLDYDEIERKAKTIKKHIKDFVWLYGKLEDDSSKFLLHAILNNFINYDFTSLQKTLNQKYHHYFDFDILPKMKEEVFADIGSYTGDTILDFIKCYGENSYKKIYCYEITTDIIPTLKNNLINYKNIEIKSLAVSNKSKTLYVDENSTSNSANKTKNKGKIKIEAKSLDEDVKEKISLIKMDIEGDEELALMGAKKHIQNDTPKLLISLYHNNNHYFKLPKLIYSYNKNYKSYLRNYGGNLYPTEIVLFAIPKNSNA